MYKNNITTISFMYTKISDFIFKSIADQGIKNVFLVPGGGNMFLVDSVKRNKKLNGINCFHEQAASISAEGYFRTSGKPGVVLVTSGPGSTNAITGLVGSWIDSIPTIIISGQVKLKDQIGKSGVRQKGPQEVQIIDSIRKFTKFAISLKSAKKIDQIIPLAIKKATSGRMGPVWIDVPLDIQSKEIKVKKSLKKIKKKLIKQNIKPVLNSLQSYIDVSKKPVLLLGQGIRLSGKINEFKKIYKKLNIPVLTTWNLIDIISYNNKLNLGSPGVVAQRYSNIAIQKSDLIICIGTKLDNITTAFNIKKFGVNAKKIVFDIDKFELKKYPKNFLTFNIDVSNLIKVLKQIKTKNYSEWINNLNFIKKKYKLLPKQKKSKYLNHYFFCEKLSEIVKENSVISLGSSGFSIETFHIAFKTKENQRIFASPGLGAMGCGLPQAVGACFGNNKKKIISIETDGSLMFNLQELATIKSYNLPIILFVFNNQGYLSIRNTQKNYFSKRYVGTGKEDGIFFPNFKDIAHSFGIKYFELFNTKKLTSNLKKILREKGLCLINVNLEKDDILMPKVGVIVKKNKIESMPLEDMNPLLKLKEMKEIMGDQISNKSIEARK